jgi:uncharacterized protein (DUF1499 family)
MLHRATIATAVSSLLLVIAGALLANRGALPPMTGMALFVLGGLGGVVALLLSVAVMVVTRHFGVALVGMLGFLPVLLVAGAGFEASRYPLINDISTDLDAVPAFTHAQSLPENAGRDLAFPPEFAPIIREHYAELAPLRLPLPADAAYARALDAARAQMKRWEITREDPAARSFEAVVATRVFRWKDDVVVRITPEGEAASRVDVRSKSREGRGDLGANARRIRQFLAAVDLKR